LPGKSPAPASAGRRTKPQWELAPSSGRRASEEAYRPPNA